MQQTPVKQTRSMPNAPKASQDDASPALLLARKIRKEQGTEQLKAYLSAIEPFIAPNELKSICTAFGLNFSSLPKNQVRQTTFRSGNISGGAPQNIAGMNIGAVNRGMRTGERANINAVMNASPGVNVNAGTGSVGNTGVSRGTGNQNRNGNINQRNKTGSNQNSGNTGSSGNANMNNGMNNGMGVNAGAGMNMGTGMKGNPIQMMQQLMQMQNLMNSGGDIQKLLNFLGKP